MTKVIGVRLRTVGKIYYFDPGDVEFVRNDHVIVETVRGVEYGLVMIPPKEVPEEEITRPLKTIIRKATDEDAQTEAENREKEKEAFRICKEKIRKHELEMKLISVEYTFDNNKILFYFTADGRVDFRELVKDLASVFRTRIELRQVGVRDETKMLGGLGICGRPFCCSTYLADFTPVSIKMAKEQNLALNSEKISGTCGKLMCCLKNEEDVYEELNKKLPAIGDYVTTADGERFKVVSINTLSGMVRVKHEDDVLVDYPADELTFKPRKKKSDKNKKDKLFDDDLDEKEIEELRKLESED